MTQHFQLPLYARGRMSWETPSLLDSTPGGSCCVRLPPWMPQPTLISSFSALCQRKHFPELTDAVLVCLIDPAGRYTKSTGYPRGGQDPGSMNELHLNDIMSNEEFARLVIVELGPNHLKRAERWMHIPPLYYSREDGDLIMLDIPGIGDAPVQPDIWFCWNLTFIDPRSYGGVIPPKKAWSVGSWQRSGVTGGTGRRISPNNDGANHSKFGFRFKTPPAPALSEIYGVKFRARNLITEAMVNFHLYGDNNGSPGVAISNPSIPWRFNYSGADHEVGFDLGGGMFCEADTWYWIVMTSTCDCLVADIDTCVGIPDYSSGRAGTVAGITNNLPNGEDWRFRVDAIAVPTA